MSELTNEQIAAGAAVLGDDGRPIGRNTAIMVADAMFSIQSPAPIPKQVAHGSGIEGLTRYQFDGNEYDEGALEPWSTGEWVKFADVERLLATQSAKQSPVAQEVTQQAAKAETNESVEHDEIKTWPERIYLQCENEHGDGVEHYGTAGQEITWCQDCISKFDVEYVRADLAPTTSTVSASGALAAADDVRDEALEEAALAVEDEVPCTCCFSDDEVALAASLAETIRAKKSKSAASTEGECIDRAAQAATDKSED